MDIIKKPYGFLFFFLFCTQMNFALDSVSLELAEVPSNLLVVLLIGVAQGRAHVRCLGLRELSEGSC